MSTDPTVWVKAILTLSVFSYLIKDNRVFGLTQKLYVGVGVGYSAALAVRNVMQQGITPLVGGRTILLIPLILGIMTYARFVKPIAWLSKIPTAFIVTLGAAITLRGTIQAQFIDQIRGTMLPLNSIDNIIIVFGTAATILYFYFRVTGKGGVGTLLSWNNKFARFIMMIALGVGYTGNLSANIPRTIGILQQLFGEWIHLIPGF